MISVIEKFVSPRFTSAAIFLTKTRTKTDKRMWTDEEFMKAALEEARLAYKKGEVPVGAVVVSGGRFWRARTILPFSIMIRRRTRRCWL